MSVEGSVDGCGSLSVCSVSVSVSVSVGVWRFGDEFRR